MTKFLSVIIIFSIFTSGIVSAAEKTVLKDVTTWAVMSTEKEEEYFNTRYFQTEIVSAIEKDAEKFAQFAGNEQLNFNEMHVSKGVHPLTIYEDYATVDYSTKYYFLYYKNEIFGGFLATNYQLPYKVTSIDDLPAGLEGPTYYDYKFLNFPQFTSDEKYALILYNGDSGNVYGINEQNEVFNFVTGKVGQNQSDFEKYSFDFNIFDKTILSSNITLSKYLDAGEPSVSVSEPI